MARSCQGPVLGWGESIHSEVTQPPPGSPRPDTRDMGWKLKINDNMAALLYDTAQPRLPR